MRKNLLIFVLTMIVACMPVMAQEVPVADLLDVQFNDDGSAVDVSPMKNAIEYYGEGTVIAYSGAFNRNVATFNNTWSKACTGYYRMDFENNETFRNALADGHSLEMLVKANYQGTIVDVEAKPFSAMQGGGTGFLINKLSNGPKNSFTFLPNVTTNGNSTWRWTTSSVIPISGFYYHVIGVWNKEEAKAYIYVDGELRNTVDAPGEFRFANAGCNWFCIGGDASGGGGEAGWNGDVAIARVYDKALSGEEAVVLWNAVKDQEKEANMIVYTEAVAEGRQYVDDIRATQVLMDNYRAALTELEALTQGGTTDELEAQYDIVKSIRTQLETSVTAYANYNEHVQTAIAYLQENNDFEGDDRDYIEQYLNDYIEPNEDYPNGSYSYIWENLTLTTEEIGAEASWVDEKLRIAIENGFKAGSDITNLLTNPSFADGFNGWSGNVGTGASKSNTTDYYGAETWARGFDMYQTLTGLENGVYVFTVTAGYRPFNDGYSTYYSANIYANENRLFLPTVYETRISVDDAVDGENCYITQNGDDSAVDLEITDQDGILTAYAMHGQVSVANAANGKRAVNYLLANVTDGTLTIGLCNPNPNASSDWTGFANIHLLYAGSLEDAEHYLDETLACMVARAKTIINITPDMGVNYAKAPNCPKAVKDKLQAAIDAVATTTSPEEKYALIGTFTALWDEFTEGRTAYVNMIKEAEICIDIASEMYANEKLSQEEYDVIDATIKGMWEAFETGTYTTEEATNMQALKSLGLVPNVDENGVYQISSNYDMAYYALKASTAGTAVNGKLLTDIDYFTENQMMEDFYGELDGNYHTITVNINRKARGAALINNMRNGACVKNLVVKGEVTNSDKFVTTIAANTYDMTTISGIVSLINGHSTCSGDSGNGGIMSCSRGSTVVKDCVFAGTMEGSSAINSSGIVGWTNGVTVVENCLQIGDITLNPEGSRTIARIPELVHISNSYYKTAFGGVDGVQITDEQLASGEVCYLLNKGNTENPTWFQTLGEDPYPVPNPSHQVVGKTADGTYTNDASKFVEEAPQPVETTPQADLLDIVFHEDGTAEDVSPMHNEVIRFGETISIHYDETYQRNVAHFQNNYGSDATSFYKAAPYDNNYEIRNALADGHSFEVLCMADYAGTIPNAEAKPLSAMQGGGTGFLVTTISGSRQNELTFLPNVTTSGASTWRWTTSGVVPEAQVFYHVVGVWNAEEHKSYIYVNGELKNTINAPGLFRLASSNCNWFGIGADPGGATSAHNAWNGDVAIARVYSKPLTQEDVAYLWNKVLNPTSIEEIPENCVMAAPSGIYDINGVRVEKPRQGIYIINGKKVLINNIWQ